MSIFTKTAGLVASLALIAPGAALAKNHKTVDTTTPAPHAAGKAGAPGQVCKALKIKGHKTAEQRAAYKACIRDAVAARKAEHAAKADPQPATAGDDDATETATPAAPDAPVAPAAPVA